MFKKILFLTGLVSAGLLLYVFNVTTPSSINAVGLLAVFVLGYLISLSSLTYLLWFMHILYVRLSRSFKLRGPSSRPSIRKSYLYSSILSLGPVLLVGLHSVNGINSYEIGLILLLLVLGCFYVARRVV